LRYMDLYCQDAKGMAMIRLIWTGAGWVCFALGVAGAALPLLPTVPFMLLAAVCFARGSERFHDWLVGHPRFGPAIQDWRTHRAIARSSKRAALVAIALSFAVSLALGVTSTVLAVQALALGAVAVFVLTRPDRPDRALQDKLAISDHSSSARSS